MPVYKLNHKCFSINGNIEKEGKISLAAFTRFGKCCLVSLAGILLREVTWSVKALLQVQSNGWQTLQKSLGNKMHSLFSPISATILIQMSLFAKHGFYSVHKYSWQSPRVGWRLTVFL